MKSVVVSVLVIVASAVPAAVVSWWAFRLLGLTGVTLSIATALAAMFLATAIFILLTSAIARFEKKDSAQ
jgi:ABC-type branched-subunit amino acid transport system permease subunit